MGLNSWAAASSASRVVPLHDTLRAERYLQHASRAFEVAIDPIGGTGKDGRTQNQQLSVSEVRQQGIYAILDDLTHRGKELINRRANSDDNRRRRRDFGWS